MIYGLAAAFGWGLSDLWAAMSSRKIGSGRTLVVAQIASGIALSAIVVVARPDMQRIPSVAPWLLANAFLMSAAFAMLYRGLQLGPIAVVTPVLATYAVIPVLLSVVLLGESLGALSAFGAAVTIAGAVLASIDVRTLREGARTRFPGLPWAIAATLFAGVATYVLAWSAQEAGFLPSLWFSRLATVVVVAGVTLLLRIRRRARGDVSTRVNARDMSFAAAIGLVEIAGGIAYARGAEVGLVSIVTAASATYPLIPVIGSVRLLKERPSPSQYLGVVLVVVGLAALGLSS
jgi:uncharacterized membrane protein